jgi:MFS transporter, AAHS family, vanillate permease
MSQQDPREWLAANPMRAAQIAVVAITVALCALDGFDVLAISFAAPGIAREWGIDRAALGVVLSMELVGMVIGSVLVGGLADRIGRRPTVLGCLVVMALGMAMVTRRGDLVSLSLWRVVTGLGIGGMIPALNALAAEFSNARRRDLCVALMAIGYPLGALTGGSVAALLLRHSDWRSVFEFGALMTALLVPVVALWVPESVAWLCQRPGALALPRVNHTLAKLGYGPVAALPVIARAPRQSLAGIFQPELRATTLLATLAYFLHIMTFYFLVKWVPKIVVDLGFAPAAAAAVLVWANVGGVTGGVVLGVLSRPLGLKAMTILLMLASTAMLAVFGGGWSDLPHLCLICALTGFCTNGAVVGMFAILARAYPAATRATGTGFAVGIGRGGAVLAPILAGLLFRAGHGLQFVALVMGAGSLLAAAALGALRVRPAQSVAAE